MAGSAEQTDLESTAPAAGDRTSKIKEALDACKSAITIIEIITMVILYLFFTILFADDINTFLISSFIGVSLDPLFLYIPLIDDNTKCLLLDNGLKKIALILRTITDCRYILRIFRTIKGGSQESSKIMKIVMNLVIDIVAVLPIPQVVILFFLPNMRGYKSLNKMKGLNSLIVLQYLARLYPIYSFCMQLNKMKLGELSKPDDPTTKTIAAKMRIDEYVDKIKSFPGRVPKLWVPGAVNFIMYIIVSHVFGAFWYFFSIQREMDCWGHACRSQNGCEFTSHCENNIFRNATLLKDFCPTNPPNATVFDFGIFAIPLQSLAHGSTDISQKILICFSWGLRNLSSFASNLNPSTYRWENFFVVAISISGLVLFIYLLGHLQTFMQATNRSDRLQQKMKFIIEPRIRSIISEYSIPNELESSIKDAVKEKLEDNEDLTVENMFSILSLDLPNYLVHAIKHSLFVNKLQKIPKLKDKNYEGLQKISEHLEPVIYIEGSYIIRQGEPLDMLFFITQGIALTYAKNKVGSGTTQHEKQEDGLYGKELITWAENASNKLSNLPISPITVKAHKKVEIFALKAADLQHVLANLPKSFCTIL